MIFKFKSASNFRCTADYVKAKISFIQIVNYFKYLLTGTPLSGNVSGIIILNLNTASA